MQKWRWNEPGIVNLCFSNVSSFVKRAGTASTVSETFDLAFQKNMTREVVPHNMTWGRITRRFTFCPLWKHILLCGNKLLVFLPTCKYIGIYFWKDLYQTHSFLLHLKGQFVGFVQTLEICIISEKVRRWRIIFAYKYCYKKSKISVIDIFSISVANFVIHRHIHLWILQIIVGLRVQ